MKTNDNFILRRIGDDCVLIPVKEAAQNFNGMIHLTPSAAFMFEEIDKSNSLNEIVEKVVEEYEVDEETARNDVFGFLHELYIRGIIQEVKEFETNE